MSQFLWGFGARVFLAVLAAVPAVSPSAGNMQAVSGVVAAAGVPAVHARDELWLPPLGYPIRISDPYRAPPTPYAAGHRGIGFPAVPGDPLASPVSGHVSFVGWVVDRGVISIRVDDHTVVSLEPIAVPEGSLAVGDPVARGQRLGEMSEGGRCAAACLHLGIRVDSEYVNPLPYFVRRPELLPW